jgi:hypothetical protein
MTKSITPKISRTISNHQMTLNILKCKESLWKLSAFPCGVHMSDFLLLVVPKITAKTIELLMTFKSAQIEYLKEKENKRTH